MYEALLPDTIVNTFLLNKIPWNLNFLKLSVLIELLIFNLILIDDNVEVTDSMFSLPPSKLTSSLISKLIECD
jgi:hypothetical protein